MSVGELLRVRVRVTRSWQRLSLILAVSGTSGAGACLYLLLSRSVRPTMILPGALLLIPLMAASALALCLSVITAFVSLTRREGVLALIGLTVSIGGLVLMGLVALMTAFVVLPFSIGE